MTVLENENIKEHYWNPFYGILLFFLFISHVLKKRGSSNLSHSFYGGSYKRTRTEKGANTLHLVLLLVF